MSRHERDLGGQQGVGEARVSPSKQSATTAWNRVDATRLLTELLDCLGHERGQRDRFSDRIVEMLLTVDRPWPRT